MQQALVPVTRTSRYSLVNSQNYTLTFCLNAAVQSLDRHPHAHQQRHCAMKKIFYHVLFFEVLFVPFIFSFQASDVFQGQRRCVYYVAAVVFAAAASVFILKGRDLRIHAPALLAWLGLTVVSAATLFFAADRYAAVFGDGRHIECVVFYVAGFFTLLGALQLDREDWQTLLNVVTWQGPVFAVFVLVQSFFQVLTYDYAGSFLTRGDAATGNPVYAAYFLVFAIAAAIAVAVRATSAWQRVMYSVFLFLEVWALVMTGTRSGWIGLAAVLVVFFVWAGASKQRKNFVAPVLVGAAFLSVLALSSPVLRVDAPLTQSVSSVGAASTSSQSVSDRLVLWRLVLHTIAQHPLLGVGADNFGSYTRSTWW